MLIRHGNPLYTIDSRSLPLIEDNIHRVSHAEITLLKKISHFLVYNLKITNFDRELEVAACRASSSTVTESLIFQDIEEIICD